MLKVLSDFAGSSIGDFQVIGTNIHSTFRDEPPAVKDGNSHDYNWHFVFGVQNLSDKSLSVEIYLNHKDTKELPHNALILGQHNADSEFTLLTQIKAFTDTYKKYHLKLDLAPNESLYVSNTYFRCLELLKNIFESLAQNEFCAKEIYGKSMEGRDLAAYIYSEEKKPDGPKPTFVITSGFHPMEADTFATEALMEYLNSGKGQKLLKYFHFVLIPVVNPDGFAHGYNGCNAKGINLYWDFREKDKGNAPEAFYLWQYLQKIKPSLYVDFHSYTFQLQRKKASPYIKPLFFYRGKEVKKLAEAINMELLALHGGSSETGPLTFAPSTLGYKLTRRFNTITYAKYHLHIMDGKEEYKKKAVSIINKIAQAFILQGFTDRRKILAPPEGGVRDRLRDIIKRIIIVTWTFRIKLPLINALRKSFTLVRKS